MNRSMIQKLAYGLATCVGIGKLPWAPGAWGTLSAIPVLLLLGQVPSSLLAAWAGLVLVSIWASGRVAKELGVDDPGIIVIDEFCGMLTAFLFVPINGPRLVIEFIAFRLFDVTKPPPIRLLERLPGGFGIVLDDVMAGLYVQLLLQGGIRYAHL